MRRVIRSSLLLCLLKHLADRPKGQLDICANILQASHQEIRQASYMDGWRRLGISLACESMNLKHHIYFHRSFLGSGEIMERSVQRLKDRTKAFDGLFTVQQPRREMQIRPHQQLDQYILVLHHQPMYQSFIKGDQKCP
jgi:hypothetical protein